MNARNNIIENDCSYEKIISGVAYFQQNNKTNCLFNATKKRADLNLLLSLRNNNFYKFILQASFF